MIDQQLLRSEPEFVKEGLAKRGFDFDPEMFKQLDEARRSFIEQSETLKAERNKASAEIPKLKREGKDASEVLERMRQVSDRIKELDEDLREREADLRQFLLSLPNLPDADVVAGGKENNEVLQVFGSKPEFEFKPRDHVELAESLGLIDYARGTKLAGSGFWIYKNLGARLEWAMLQYFIEEHLKDGYEMILPPHILNYESGLTAGQFPKFEEDVYWLDGGREKKAEGQFILPTSETALVNFYRDEILQAEALPAKFFSYTPCYRREGGGYRADERGMIRGHQFNKVEIFQYTLPEDSDQAFEELHKKACALMEGLGLHFRLSKLAAQDCSASMARTYDIEVWIPSINDYKETSSASNARDYQARRGNVRYRDPATGKPAYLHTLNASGLATSRVFPAILEQNQQADGTVRVPKVLQKYMGGLEVISKP